MIRLYKLFVVFWNLTVHPPPTKIANHDLLHELFQWMQMLRPLSQGIIKVCSHQELAKISDPIEAWAIRGNESADELASHAYLRFPKILQVRQKLLSELRSLESIKSVLHRTIINVRKSCFGFN